MIGIDVSHYQGMIDWHQVVNDNTPKIEFAFLKATQGATYVDNMLKYNSHHAANYQMPISYYHFATLNTDNIKTDAENEAAFFVSTIKTLPKNSFPVALDIESNKSSISKSNVLIWINTFFAAMNKLGYQDCFLYSYTPFLNENLPTNHNLGNIPLWIAAYTKTLKLPLGWSKENIWQYSAKGKVNGIHTEVDMNNSKDPIQFLAPF